ncbi:MAG: FAD-dependent oxidoreductase [Candidatus Contendobacter sp.]|nr:FAD-dependent oxidoreductase [Candidatus Contendobacter sp.]MDG4558314.1 FAD-dependent oxidoreductase [Candidatus Contendobacter sp.]
MKIAIIGTGISGLTAAWQLRREHDLTLFEANDYVGGHAHTVDVEVGGRRHAVDTGFIVFNDWTYPNFLALLEQLGVASQPTRMSFSVRCERTGLEYNGENLNTLFAQRRNLFRPSFHRMIRDILRFNREAPALLNGRRDIDLDAWLREGNYSREFTDHYILPMAAAIWSAEPVLVGEMPARFFVRFFKNHGLLSVNDRPQWRVIHGGSRTYVEALTTPFRDHIRLNSPVEWVRRLPTHVQVKPCGSPVERFDQVIIATHSDQALRLLADPTPREREILGAIPYQENEVVLHTDTRLLPRWKRAWAAWNYHLPAQPRERVAVTYNMNVLQGLDAPETLCVTLNRGETIDPARVLYRTVYHHPVFTEAGVRAQARRDEISGVYRTWYCGAYWSYGFHEDGVNSGLAVARGLLESRWLAA